MNRSVFAIGHCLAYPLVAGFLLLWGDILQYDRPFKTYSEQIDILVNKYGLSVNSRDFAEIALKTMTYYDLINGYKDCFMENEKFYPGLSIEFLYTFSFADKTLQTVLFKYSTIVENSFKSKLAYVLSERFGVCQDTYLDESNYYKSNGKITFQHIKQHCVNIYDTSNPRQRIIPQPTRHYVENHNHIPPWILFKNVTFGNSINLIKLFKRPEKEMLANLILPNNNLSYDEKISFILSALNIIRNFRNVIAHNLKFVTYKSIKRPLSPKITIKYLPKELIGWSDYNKSCRGADDIYADILSIISVLGDECMVNCFCHELLDCIYVINAFEKQGRTDILKYYMNITNLPMNLEDRLNKYINK